ncbi:MAG: hypothetical protein ABI671_12515 [Burkholderiales bacterium]
MRPPPRPARPARFRAGALAGALVVGAALSPALAAPAAGRYAAALCVATSKAAPSCGPAVVDLQSSGAARVRISDIVYRLKLNSSQVEVVVMHGAMQIDEFVAHYEWAGNSLQFVDTDKNARYELKLGERKAAK